MFNDGGLQQAASRSLATALWRAARTRLASPSAHRAACQVRARDQEARIAEREDKLARADVIDVSTLSGDTVKFGLWCR